MADLRVAWVEFDAGAAPLDTRVSWVEFDTGTQPLDVRVSWVEFDCGTAAQPQPEEVLPGYGGWRIRRRDRSRDIVLTPDRTRVAKRALAREQALREDEEILLLIQAAIVSGVLHG